MTSQEGGPPIPHHIDYEKAKSLLQKEIREIETAFRNGRPPEVSRDFADATAVLMRSSTQAYREALLGCIVARILNPDIDIHYPHTKLGENAFSGRGLDEHVINPFLRENEIPCSGGPYLSALRRGVALVLPVPEGQRDKRAFKQLVKLADILQTGDRESLYNFLRYFLYNFLDLREQSQIQLIRVQRMSLGQYETLLERLLSTPSGGRLPVYVVVAIFRAIQQYFELDWSIEWQEINVSDAARNVGGDITIRRNGDIVLAVEVTERPLDESRVRTVFRTKISKYVIDDYIFFFTATSPSEVARRTAQRFFTQGHHISFLQVKNWAIGILGTIGAEGRACFNDTLVGLLDRNDVPREIKVAWNRYLEDIVAT